MEKKTPKLALVIGSGGLKCAAAIGVMEVLEQQNIAVDLVVGCSGGAVFGGAIALGFSVEEIAEKQEQGWTSDLTRHMDFGSLRKIVLPRMGGFDDLIGIFKDELMLNNLSKTYGVDTSFQDTRIPFYCVATDFNTGNPVVISEGNLAEAVRISSGIPVLFKPVPWKGKLLIDGGLSNPLPVDIAIQEGADLILAVGFETPLLPSVSSAGNFARQMFNILVNQLLYKQFAFYNLAYHSEIITIVPEFKEEIKINAVESVPFIIDQGRKETLKHLAYIQKMLAASTKPEEQPRM
jgi:NTE family protein